MHVYFIQQQQWQTLNKRRRGLLYLFIFVLFLRLKCILFQSGFSIFFLLCCCSFLIVLLIVKNNSSRYCSSSRSSRSQSQLGGKSQSTQLFFLFFLFSCNIFLFISLDFCLINLASIKTKETKSEGIANDRERDYPRCVCLFLN